MLKTKEEVIKNGVLRGEAGPPPFFAQAACFVFLFFAGGSLSRLIGSTKRKTKVQNKNQPNPNQQKEAKILNSFLLFIIFINYYKKYDNNYFHYGWRDLNPHGSKAPVS